MPQNMRNRITFLSVAICGMFFYFLWEAMLISYVATPKVFRPFDSLEEFLHNTNKKVKYISIKNSFPLDDWEKFLKNKFLSYINTSNTFAAIRSKRNGLWIFFSKCRWSNKKENMAWAHETICWWCWLSSGKQGIASMKLPIITDKCS